MRIGYSRASRCNAAADAAPTAAWFGALRAIQGEIHVHGNAANWKHPLRLGLAFSGRPYLRLRERRGDAVAFDTQPLAREDFADGSRVEVHDLTDVLAPELRGAAVQSLAEITDGQGSVIGLALLRGGEPPFCIWVEDDEFTWGDEAALEAAVLEDGAGGVIGAELRLS